MSTTQTDERPPLVTDEELDDAVTKLNEAKARERAIEKAAKKAKRAERKAKVAHGFKATGAAVIDTDLRDVGKGFKSFGRFVKDHTPRVKIVHSESQDS